MSRKVEDIVCIYWGNGDKSSYKRTENPHILLKYDYKRTYVFKKQNCFGGFIKNNYNIVKILDPIKSRNLSSDLRSSMNHKDWPFIE